MPYQFIFVLERILIPSPHLNQDHVVEEREFLSGFTKAENEFTPGELFRILESVYRILVDNYRDSQFNETEA